MCIRDRYNAENLKVSGENVTFEWSPLRKATSHKGTVRFSVCVTEEGTDREWNTTIATLNVLEGEELFTEKEREERGSDFAGILTADATADADSIELGKSAYVNGKKIEGALTSKNEIKAVTKKTELSSTPIIIPNYGQSTMPVLKHTIEVSLADTNKPVLLKGDAKKTIVYDEAGSIYGDAKASDVRAGKTFTSSNGVKNWILKCILATPTVENASYYKSASRYWSYGILNVKWDPIEDATSYEVCITKEDGAEKVFTTTYNSLFVSDRFDDFVANGMDGATVKVKAYGDNDTFGCWSDDANIVIARFGY